MRKDALHLAALLAPMIWIAAAPNNGFA